jgi:P-type Cu2+ transporter
MVLAPPPIQSPAQTTPQDTVILDIMGLKCGGCVRNAEGKIRDYPGVREVSVNLVTELATVDCDPVMNREGLAQMLTAAGFPAVVRSSDEEDGADPFESARLTERQTQQRQLLIALGLLVLSSASHLAHQFGVMVPYLSSDWFHGLLAGATLLGPGRSILVDGARSLLQNSPNMNTLLGFGASTAFVTSLVALVLPKLGWECFFDEPVMLIGFILLGRTLEQRARHRAASALTQLVALQSKTARVVGKDGTRKMADLLQLTAVVLPVSNLSLGDWVQILPGEQIPIDGEIIDGETTVDESMLTGESLPVLKQPGQSLYAGTLNQSGAVVLRVLRCRNQTTLAQIINLVETAQARKAPIQQMADRLAGQFTYIMMALSGATFLFWSLWGAEHFGQSLQHEVMGHMMHGASSQAYSPMLLSLKLAIAVLVVACPCALGLATPTALLVGSGIGAERGLLIRGGDILEKAHRLDTVVFDKTGTLTEGQPQVDRVEALQPGWTETQLLQLAASVEQGTQHPLAQAIAIAAKDLTLLPTTAFKTLVGYGAEAEVEGRRVLVGSVDWLRDQGLVSADLEAEGTIYIAVAGQVVGRLTVSNRLRPEAQATVAKLQAMGLRVMLLSGDRADAAQAVALQVGIPADQVLAGVKPEGKAAAIAALQAEGGRVAMVGDGINDAPALAQADVGIALQSGTEVAAETADILLMRNALSDVPEALRLSRMTFGKIQQNLAWALLYNLLAIPVAAGLLVPHYNLLLSPGQAGFLMALSSITVVLNALLLRWQFRTGG